MKSLYQYWYSGVLDTKWTQMNPALLGLWSEIGDREEHKGVQGDLLVHD